MNKKLKFGVYADRYNISGEKIIEVNGLKDVEWVESLSGQKVDSIMWYPFWGKTSKSKSNFPYNAASLVRDHGAIPHLTWEFAPEGGNPIESPYSLQDLLRGEFDDYIRDYAKSCREFKDTLFIRFLHEFNGTWYGWSGIKNDKNPNIFIEAWRHVIDIFRNIRADNVKWLWCPNGICGGTPDSDSWNRPENYWPGGDWVDYIAFDAYNFFPFFECEQPLMSFDDCFSEIYKRCSLLNSDIPMMIAEFATGEYQADEYPHNKKEWIEDAFEKLNSKEYERIEYVFWFNVNKERDWSINSTPETLEVFKQCIK